MRLDFFVLGWWATSKDLVSDPPCEIAPYRISSFHDTAPGFIFPVERWITSAKSVQKLRAKNHKFLESPNYFVLIAQTVQSAEDERETGWEFLPRNPRLYFYAMDRQEKCRQIRGLVSYVGRDELISCARPAKR